MAPWVSSLPTPHPLSSWVVNSRCPQAWVSRNPQGHGIKGQALPREGINQPEAEGTVLCLRIREHLVYDPKLGLRLTVDVNGNSPEPQSPPASLLVGRGFSTDHFRILTIGRSCFTVHYLQNFLLALGATKQSQTPLMSHLPCSRPCVKAFTCFLSLDPCSNPIS